MCEATHIGERIDMPATPVQRRRGIAVRANQLGASAALQLFDRRATLLPVRGALRQRTLPGRRMRREDQAGADGPAVDSVALDQVEDQRWPIGHRIDHALPALGAIMAQDRRVVLLQIRHHLTEGAARRTPADLLRLQHRHFHAGLSQMQRGRKPREAAPDHSRRDMVPRDMVPRDMVPRDMVPRDLVPRDTTPRDTARLRQRQRRGCCRGVPRVDCGWRGLIRQRVIHRQTMRPARRGSKALARSRQPRPVATTETSPAGFARIMVGEHGTERAAVQAQREIVGFPVGLSGDLAQVLSGPASPGPVASRQPPVHPCAHRRTGRRALRHGQAGLLAGRRHGAGASGRAVPPRLFQHRSARPPRLRPHPGSPHAPADRQVRRPPDRDCQPPARNVARRPPAAPPPRPGADRRRDPPQIARRHRGLRPGLGRRSGTGAGIHGPFGRPPPGGAPPPAVAVASAADLARAAPLVRPATAGRGRGVAGRRHGRGAVAPAAAELPDHARPHRRAAAARPAGAPRRPRAARGVGRARRRRTGRRDDPGRRGPAPASPRH